MLFKKSIIATLTVSAILLTSCNMFVTPGSMIKPPSKASEPSKTNEDIAEIAKKFIPDSSRLVNPEQPQGASGVQSKDINGDGKDEIIALYQTNGEQGSTGILILQKDNKNNWNKIYDFKSEGYSADILKFSDITGDGVDEILVGWRVGSTASGLNILQWQDNQIKQIADDYYGKIEVEDMPNEEGKKDGKSELALWQHDTGAAYKVEVYRWDGSKLAPAKDVYQYYFKRVAQYYEQRVQEMPDAAFYWYYLADAQLKSGDPKAALQSVEQGLNIKKNHPDYYPQNEKFDAIKKEALSKLAK